MTEEKTTVKNSIGRAIFFAISILIQVGWLLILIIRLNDYSAVISLCSSLIALVIVLRIYGTRVNSAFKFPWVILILVFPVLGLSLYLLIGRSPVTRAMRERFEKTSAQLAEYYPDDSDEIAALEALDFSVANQFRYVSRHAKYPVYRDTDVQFYPEATQGLEAQLEALRAARRFIFMEYHAIEDAAAFARIRDVLAEKAMEGVEIRILYDDIGSMGFISTDFIVRMERLGIQCRVFNPMLPIVNVFMNNRDHRKITVVDGTVGFTGGYNLADEYFDLVRPYGQWKDTGIKLTGAGVRSLTLMFLEMWNFTRESDNEIEVYLPQTRAQAVEGFVQPYADTPLDQEFVGENVYLNMIKHAKHYIWFTTPYLILTDEMTRELALAAKRGVDVRIITPRIPDKKLIFNMTRSYYAGLVEHGVRIFEFVPGFMHAKQCVCDGELAAVGTINLDYRSLYLHFENGVLFYRLPAVAQVEQDFRDTFPLCEDVSSRYLSGRPAALRAWQCVLRLFSPLF